MGLELHDIQRTSLSRKSWVAYARLFPLKLLTIWVLSWILKSNKPEYAGIISNILIISAYLLGVRLLIQVLHLASYELYFDKQGVWLRSGLFPWDRGAFGIDWRDTEGCLTVRGFISWISRSSEIIIAHRFTDSSKIRVGDMTNALKTCNKINQLHQELVRSNSLAWVTVSLPTVAIPVNANLRVSSVLVVAVSSCSKIDSASRNYWDKADLGGRTWQSMKICQVEDLA